MTTLGKLEPKIPTEQLIKRLHLMGNAGGMLTPDRVNVILQAADRLEELDERVDIMMETEHGNGFNVFHAIPHFPEVAKHES